MFGWLRSVGKWVKKAVGFVEKYVSDETLMKAVSLVREMRDKYDTNEERREAAVRVLVATKVPENVARLAVELAVGLVKKELDKK